MENKISRLQNYTIQDNTPDSAAESRCRFYYLANDYLWKEFDIEGHHTLDEAFEFAKDQMVNDLIKMALNESIRSLDLKSKHFHFRKDGEVEDLRDFTFYEDVLDENSQIFKEFKKLLMNNWNEDMEWYYFIVDSLKDADIHDDDDKKRLYNHYFDSLVEFKERKSFLEYSNRYNHDREETSRLRRIHYNFIEYGDYHCIDNSVTRKELKNFLISNKTYCSDEHLLYTPVSWAAFGYYFGKRNGLSEIESKGFANTLGLFFSEGIEVNKLFINTKNGKDNWSTEKYFKEALINDVVGTIISRSIDGKLTDYSKEIFYTIFDIYKNRIQDFEYKTKRLEFRVSQRQYDQFMSLDGKSKSDKLDSLMTYSREEVENSLLPEIDLDEKSLEKWKESNKSTADYEYRDEWMLSPKKTLEEIYGDDKQVKIINSQTGILSPEEKLVWPSEEVLKEIEREEEEELQKEMEEAAKEYHEYLKFLKKTNPEEYERIEMSGEEIDRFKEENPNASFDEIFERIKKIDAKFEELKDKYPDASVKEIFEKIRGLKL